MLCRPLLTAALLFVLVPLASPAASADHPQLLPSGQTLVFDHAAGNEWWVEVRLGGSEGPWIVIVEARDTGGEWISLQKEPWGTWGASFHIEPGHTIEFRATTRGDVTLTSCRFTHPAGIEDCSTRGPAPFDATFRNLRGNAWWIETEATAKGGAITTVEVRVNDGPWTGMQRTAWGSWARSAPVPAPAKVEFRALSDGGDKDVSGKIPWPPARR